MINSEIGRRRFMSKINPDYLCPGCMAVLDEPDLPCPLCGFDKVTYAPSPRSLRPFTRLNGKYLVGKVIGEGGFGITYIGFNMETDLPVAIKEYFPSELATRDTTQGNTVTIFSGEAQSLFKEGLEKYLREARNLSMFSDLQGIVTVKDFFYENETAYIIMEYINGITLKQYLTKVGGRMKQNEVIKMMKPVLESMVKIHEVGIIHRDISPDNIMITKNKQIKLTDFGAARVFDTEDSKSITVVLKRGYAPEEQYRAKGNQGPWTDVYALCATMYRMITGVTPQEALERIIDDNVEKVSKYDPNVWPETEYAIMKGLSLRAEDRWQSVNDLIDALYYSVLEYDADGNPHLKITKEGTEGAETETETPILNATVEEVTEQPKSEEEFDSSPIVIKINSNPSGESDTSEAEEEKKEEVAETQVTDSETSEEIKLEHRRTDILEFNAPAPEEKEEQEDKSSKKPEKKKSGGFFKSTFKKLVKLQLGKVRFEDNVTDLNVEHMDVGNISVLSGCYELKKLVLSNNMVDDLEPLRDHENLEYLALKNTLVSNLAPISTCPNIKYLDLWGTRVTDLHDIYELKNLTYLCVKNTELRKSQIDDFKKHNPACVVDY